MTVFIFGVSGCGKSTVARQLAHTMQWHMIEADDEHPLANIRKMTAGIPLNDSDRIPWLQKVNRRIRTEQEAGHTTVVACSALKQSYRAMLEQEVSRPIWILLHGSESQLAERLRNRTEHFMPAELLRSQINTLELPDQTTCVVSISSPPDQQIRQIIHFIEEMC